MDTLFDIGELQHFTQRHRERAHDAGCGRIAADANIVQTARQHADAHLASVDRRAFEQCVAGDVARLDQARIELPQQQFEAVLAERQYTERPNRAVERLARDQPEFVNVDAGLRNRRPGLRDIGWVRVQRRATRNRYPRHRRLSQALVAQLLALLVQQPRRRILLGQGEC